MPYDAFTVEDEIQKALEKERARISSLVVKMWEHRDDDKSVRCHEINVLLRKLGSEIKLEEP